MLGSIKIAVVRGIPIRVHFTLLIAFVLLTLQLGWLGVPAGLLLFGSVLAHELGHSVVAQRYGIGISGIELHLLGGTALMRAQAANPSQEIRIALAGPAVSLAIGASASLVALLLGVQPSFAQFGLIDLLPYVAGVNLAMAVFNMIPALPMDGGRVLRAVLAKKYAPLTATRFAARLSRVFAGLFVVGGLFWGAFTLPLIGVMLFMLSKQEERAAELREAQRLAQQAARLAWFWRVPPQPVPLRTVIIDSKPL